MSKHSYNKIWIHFIWETPDKEKNIFMKVNYVNADHVHAVVDLPTNLSVEDCIKLLKGSSSFYVNKNRVTRNKFSWGKGYGAFSVSASQLNNVVNYVKNQEEHHRVKSFAEEYQQFIKKYSIDLKKNG